MKDRLTMWGALAIVIVLAMIGKMVDKYVGSDNTKNLFEAIVGMFSGA